MKKNREREGTEGKNKDVIEKKIFGNRERFKFAC